MNSKTPYIAKAPAGFTFGADPELFVLDIDNTAIVSCHDILPGTKADPYPVPGGAVQVDGTAAEFNINPSSSFEEFNQNIESVLSSLQGMLPARHKLMALASHEYGIRYFEKLPYSAIELGCMPDYDAWTGKRNPKPKASGHPTLRTAAGHLHIGWDSADGSPHNPRDPVFLAEANLMIQLMDWHVGAWSCTVDPDRTRRALYGKAGACRYKPYGVEYRTLSNFWVLDEVKRLEVWNRMQQAVHDFVAIRSQQQTLSIPGEDLVMYINTGQMSGKIHQWLF